MRHVHMAYSETPKILTPGKSEQGLINNVMKKLTKHRKYINLKKKI